ncbi:MAG: magnesium transporter CorA family protein [Thermoplasmatota archaeon]
MRVLSFNGESWREQDLKAEGLRAQVTEDRLTWVRAVGLSADDVERLGADFGIHPLAVEDAMTERQRPKVEDYPALTFVVVRVPRWDDDLTWHHIGLALGPDYLMTISSEPLPELDVMQARLLTKSSIQSADRLLHMALDFMVDAWFPYLDELEAYIEEIEDEASRTPTPATLARIREMKSVVARTRKVTAPMREAMLSLERAPHPNVHDDARLYLRDVSDHMVRLAERLEHVKEMTLIAQETWNASLANSQNHAMKRLTVIFALFLVPTFLAGLGGMNFEGVPDWSFQHVALALFGIVAIGLGVSLWKRWL